jgi:hypothetical protein
MSMVRTQNVEDSVEFKESYFDFYKGYPALVNHFKQLWWKPNQFSRVFGFLFS